MIPASVRIFIYTEPQDMRRSFDGLARAATVLDPPPADSAIAHPSLTPEQREQLAPILERTLAALPQSEAT